MAKLDEQYIPGFDESDTARRVSQRFGEITKRRIVPLLSITARALRIHVRIIVESSPPLVISVGQAKVPDPSLPGSVATRPAHLERIGKCNVSVSAEPAAEDDGGDCENEDRLALIETLLPSLCGQLERAAVDACTEIDSLLGRAAFLHQYIHGLSVICPDVRILFNMLQIPRIAKKSDEDLGQRVLSPGQLRQLAEHLRTLDYLVNAERHNAVNLFSFLMPEFMPGVERSQWEVCNPTEFLKALVAGYEHQANKRMIEFEFDREGKANSMPPVRIERNSFDRMMHSLLSNAVKYSYHGIQPEGWPKSRIVKIVCQPRYDKDGRFCMIGFENFGIGIEPDEIAHVTEAGYRGRLAKAEIQIGTGLGLSEAAHVVHAHKGRLSIRSRPVHNSTYLTEVRVILPVAHKRQQGGQHV